MSRARTDTPIEPMDPPPPPVVQHAAVEPAKAALARQFRRHPTAAEATAWEILRGRKILGLKFVGSK